MTAGTIRKNGHSNGRDVANAGKPKMKAPDGGWGWMVVLASSIVELTTRTLDSSFGLLFGDILRSLNVGTISAAVIVSTQDTMISLSGLFAGPLLRRFSYRTVTVFGVALVATGILSTVAATSVAHIIATYGVMVGLGAGFASASTFVALSNYWVARRGQAIGLSMAGTGLGFMFFPHLIRLLLDELGFRGTLLVLGGIVLHGLIGAVLLQPIEWHRIPADEPEEKEEPSLENTGESQQPLLKNRGIDVTLGKQNEISSVEEATANTPDASFLKEPTLNSSLEMATIISSPSSMAHCDEHKACGNGRRISRTNFPRNMPQKPTFWGRLAVFLDLDLFRDPHYGVVTCGLVLFWVAEIHFKMVVPFFLADLKLDNADVAFCLSITAAADILARLVLPPLFDRVKYKKRTIFFVACVSLGISRSVFAQQTQWTPMLTAMIIAGFCRGATLINYRLTVAECVPLERLAGAFGLNMVSKGLAVVALGPALGLIRDVTGSFPLFIHAQTALMGLGLLPWVIEWIVIRLRTRHSKVHEPVDHVTKLSV